MPRSEQVWSAGLLSGVLLVGALTVGPALWPRPRVPTVTRAALPAATAPPSTEPLSSGPAPTEPPRYATTGSIAPLISGRVNLNTATQEQLEALPKVGPSLALRIIGGRPYRSVADLDRVRGVGEATLRALSPLVSF
ncbi:ComEA family DNA-binding protein [Deinococcus koreensis]|uniref:Competence protein ComEA n=1 Tax=Deinococcus koreensis TaxID=2054903 RepID=A0A2K3UZ76_9DEIO|nr:helix-hairpin-helix domain-containing protein [Deinococcus koreensis]PNY81830.1 competence protein ComEA [Deinococcus koreensis]